MADGSRESPEFQVQLNDFQRAMLQWHEQQPFQVADIVAIHRSIDARTLQTAAERELLSAGIAAPSVDKVRGVCTFRPIPCTVETTVIVVPSGQPILPALEQHASAELRRALRIDLDPLIRLWMISNSATTYVGMTWQHWMGDGMTAGDLLHRILARALGWRIAEESALRCWRETDERRIFGRWLHGTRVFTHAVEVARTMSTNHEVVTAPRRTQLTPARCHFVEAADDALERIRRFAAPHQATVNDVLVAVVGQALATSLPRAARRWWQHRVRIANIVDLRPTAGAALQGKGGLFLGLANWDCPIGIPHSLAHLVRGVRAQSQRSKRGRLWMASLGGFRTARCLWPWLPADWRRPILSRIMRLTAVMTNLRYPVTWYQGASPGEVGAYWRAVPTSLMAPLIVSVTTLGQKLTMTLSCDETGAIADCLGAIKNNLQTTLASLR